MLTEKHIFVPEKMLFPKAYSHFPPFANLFLLKLNPFMTDIAGSGEQKVVSLVEAPEAAEANLSTGWWPTTARGRPPAGWGGRR